MTFSPLSFAEDSSDEEGLLDYEEACDEVAELEGELRAAKIEVQQLSIVAQTALRSQASPMRSAAFPKMPKLETLSPQEERRLQELQESLVWIAEHADLSRPEVLDVGFAVPIGGRTVHLQRIVQWSLPSAPSGRLRFSVPVGHQELFTDLLSTTQAKKAVDPVALREFAGAWDAVPGELSIGVGGTAEPSLLLAHRSTSQGALVATWPSREALEAFHATRAISSAVPMVGDRIEVDIQGERCVGTLLAVDANGRGTIRCDKDAPGVVALASVACLRCLAPVESEVAEQGQKAQEPMDNVVVDCTENEGDTPVVMVKAPCIVPGHRRTRSSAL